MRRFFVSTVFLLAAGGSTLAQSPIQRGDYLVNSISELRRLPHP